MFFGVYESDLRTNIKHINQPIFWYMKFTLICSIKIYNIYYHNTFSSFLGCKTVWNQQLTLLNKLKQIVKVLFDRWQSHIHVMDIFPIFLYGRETRTNVFYNLRINRRNFIPFGHFIYRRIEPLYFYLEKTFLRFYAD